MEREIVTGAGVPAQIGPYSQAVRAGGFVYVSGQPGVHPETGEEAGPSFSEQARQAFANLDAVLRAGGSQPDPLPRGLLISIGCTAICKD